MLAVLGTNGDMCFLDLESGKSVSKLVFNGVGKFFFFSCPVLPSIRARSAKNLELSFLLFF